MNTIWEKDYAMVFWANKNRDPVDTVFKTNKFLRQYGDDYYLEL